MKIKQQSWSRLSKIFILSLVIGMSVTGCVKNTPPIIEEEQSAYISCELPTSTQVAPLATSYKTTNELPIQSLSSGSSGVLEKLTILTLNDTHGGIQQSENNEYGFGRVATYFESIRAENPLDDVVTLAAGDMFQGSALSNLTKGGAVIDVMNHVGFDAMTLGNHEFDWGIETVMRFNDDDLENGEAQFPLLNANTMNKETNTPASFHNPYIVIEKENIRVGIIGLMGYGLESSIAAKMIQDYTFSSPIVAAGNFAEILRRDEAVDIVIALGHFDDDGTNSGIAALTGNQKVDAIINGHGHQSYANQITRNIGMSVPVVQAGANGQRIGKIDLYLDTNKQITQVAATTQTMNPWITPDSQVETIIAAAEEQVAPIMNQVFGSVGENISRASDVYSWAPEVIQKGMGVDVGITNSGGLRSGAFPMYVGQDVKYSNMVSLMPFDNYIVYMKLPGSFLYSYHSNLISIRAGVTIKNDQTLYKVAIIDYVADGSPMLFGTNKTEYTRTNILLMDLLAYDVHVASTLKGSWKPKSEGASLSSICTFRN